MRMRACVPCKAMHEIHDGVRVCVCVFPQCVNMCKIPTQSFFTDDFGLPLTMKPNFDDLSCQMIFGQPPEPETVDAAFQQPCFKVQCAMSEPTVAKPCVKLPQVTPAVAPVKSV